jgi:hypothetical protein
MRTPEIVAALTLIALVTAMILAAMDPAFAMGRIPNPSGPAPGSARGAPGPIAGAGLLTVMVGAGAYWLLRRSRKKR